MTPRVLADIREALGDEVVGGDLERLGQAPCTRRRAAPARRRARRAARARRQPMAADHGRMDSPRHLTQLVQRCLDLASRPLEPPRGRGSASPGLLEQAQLERERDEPLLRTVVQVALQPLPLPLTRLDHRAREPRAPRGARCSSACSRAFSSAIRRGRGDRSRAAPARPATPDRARAPPRVRRPGRSASWLARAPLRAAPPAGRRDRRSPELGQPIRERQRRVTQRPCEGITEVRGAGSARSSTKRSPTADRASRASRSPIQERDRRKPDAAKRRPADLAAPGPRTPRKEEERDHHEPERERSRRAGPTSGAAACRHARRRGSTPTPGSAERLISDELHPQGPRRGESS